MNPLSSRRPRRARAASLLRVLAGIGAALIAVFLLGIALYAAPADPTAARAFASRELRMRALEDDERIEYVLPVHRRRIWEYFRATHGLLVATDRRLLFIGLPPTIRSSTAQVGEPPPIEELAFSYDDVRAATGRVFLGRSPGIVLRTSAGRERFAVSPAVRPALDSLFDVIEHQKELRRVAAEREREAREEAERKARAPVCHRVGRGEALERIAARYGVPVATLQELNGLTTTRIRAGDTLLVRAGDPRDAGGKRCELADDPREWGLGVPE